MVPPSIVEVHSTPRHKRYVKREIRERSAQDDDFVEL